MVLARDRSHRFPAIVSTALIAAVLALAGAAPTHAAPIPERRCDLADRTALQRPAGGEVAAGYGLRRNPLTRRVVFHAGADYRVQPGQPIATAGPGRVTEIGRRAPGDRFVIIDHGGDLVIRYDHLGRSDLRPATCISSGQTIGFARSRGPAGGALTLHVETIEDGLLVDPESVFPPR